jgi:hypothetical protein|nr:MAG TPA: hypothetical protein [Caudoviricetes sp.]
MEKNNCLRCNFRHTDNGNCTAVGGFCTAVPAAYCPLLRQYLDTGLTPEEVLPKDKADEIALKLMRLADLESFCNYTSLRELAEADKDGRVAVLPVGTDGAMLDTSYPENPRLIKRVHFAVAYVSEGVVFHQPYNIFLENTAAGYISPLSEEAEKALEAMTDE